MMKERPLEEVRGLRITLEIIRLIEWRSWEEGWLSEEEPTVNLKTHSKTTGRKNRPNKIADKPTRQSRPKNPNYKATNISSNFSMRRKEAEAKNPVMYLCFDVDPFL